MPIATVQPNPFLQRPSLRALADVYLATSFPLALPADLSAAPLRWSTEDLTAPAALGGGVYERRLLDVPAITWTRPDPFSGAQDVEAVTLALFAGDGALDAYFTGELRGKRVRLHLIDVLTGEVQADVFVGALAALTMGARTAELTLVGLDATALARPFPAGRVTTSTFAYAPQNGGPTGGLGAVIAEGIGVGIGLPCPQVRDRDDVGTLLERTFTANASTNTLGITAHGRVTGDGPYQVTNAGGALPGGLAAGVPYWIIVVDVDTVQLATTPGNAATGTAIDLTTAGTGTHTLRGGRPPQSNDEYDYVLGYGNLAIDRLAQTRTMAPYRRGLDFAVLPQTYTPGGRYVTAVRFSAPNLDPTTGGKGALLADVRRYPDMDPAVRSEWKWANGFFDDVGGRDAYTIGTLTTGDIVTGMMGVGLGAVRCPGDGVSCVLLPSAGLALRTFAWEFLVCPDPGTDANAVLFLSPGWTFTTGWGLSYDQTTQTLTYGATHEGGGTVTLSGSVPAGRYSLIQVVRDDYLGTTALYRDGVLLDDDPFTVPPIVYSAAETDALCLYTLPGLLDWVRVSDRARTPRELLRSSYLLRRNPGEWLRDLITVGMGEQVDEATLASTTAALGAVEGGALRCDHWLTAPGRVQDAVGELLAFRELAPVRSTADAVGARAAAPITEVTASFGLGDRFANVVAFEGRQRASLTEAIRQQPLAYRPVRDETGALIAYGQRRVADGLPIGKDAEPLALPAVYDHVTADLVRHWIGTRLRRDELLRLVVGHEGRTLRPGQVVRVSLPPGLASADYEVLAVTNGVRTTTLTLAPYDESAFVYAPQLVPTDPIVDTRTSLFLGTTPGIRLTQTVDAGTGVKQITATLRLTSLERLRPIAEGSLTQFQTVVGGPAHFQAVDDPGTHDGDTSYVEQTSVGLATELLRFPKPSGQGVPEAVGVQLYAKDTGAGTKTLTLALRVNGTLYVDGSQVLTATGSYAGLLHTYLSNPVDARAWEVADLDDLEIGGQGNVPSGTLRMTQVIMEVFWRHEIPADFGFVKWWRVGPSASAPVTPDEDADPYYTGGLAQLATDAHVLDATGTWWYWARVYDALGRFAALIGPASITVT